MEGPCPDKCCGESMQIGKRAKAGYHHGDGILPFVLRDHVRFVRTWSSPLYSALGQSLRMCVPGACTPLTRCNTQTLRQSLCAKGHSPLESLRRVYARTQENGKISLYRGCSFMGECGILSLVQQIRICGGEFLEGKYLSNVLRNDSLLGKRVKYGCHYACFSAGIDGRP